MNKEQAHIDQLFRRYLRGEVGAREEAELEKYAREDEALATAIQAIRDQPTLDHSAAVERIKGRLPSEKRQERPLIYRWAAAAAVLLLLGASVLWLPQQLSTGQDGIAMREVKGQELPTEVAIMDARESSVNISDTLNDGSLVAAADEPIIPAAAKLIRGKKEPETVAAPEKKQEIALTADELSLAMEPSASSATTTADDASAQEEAEIVAAPARIATKTNAAVSSPSPLLAPAAAMPAQDRTETNFTTATQLPSVAGYITDEEGEAIMGVEVLLAGQPIGIRTDSNGFFMLRGVSGNERITLSHPGYRAFTLSFGRGQRVLQIVLEAMKEKANTDWMLEAARTNIYPNPAKSFAYPEQGMRALKKAILQQIPEELRSGKVRFNFSVDAVGKVVNVTADEGTPAALLEIVRNYLRQSSRWQVSSSGDEAVEVSMLLRF